MLMYTSHNALRLPSLHGVSLSRHLYPFSPKRHPALWPSGDACTNAELGDLHARAGSEDSPVVDVCCRSPVFSSPVSLARYIIACTCLHGIVGRPWLQS